MSKRKLSTFERLSQGKMNRKQRKELARRLYSDDPGLEVVHRMWRGSTWATKVILWPWRRDAIPPRYENSGVGQQI